MQVLQQFRHALRKVLKTRQGPRTLLDLVKDQQVGLAINGCV